MAELPWAVVFSETGVLFLEEHGPGWFFFTKTGSTLVEVPSSLRGLSSHLPNASQRKYKSIFYSLCIKYIYKRILKHCVLYFPGSPSPDASEWSVFLGQQLVNGSEVFEMSVSVVKIIVSQNTDVNIALLRLGKPVNYRDYIQPVCMDINNARSFPIGTQCWVAGWEKDSKGRGRGLSSFRVCFQYKCDFSMS